MDWRQKFGGQVRDARKAKGWSQDELVAGLTIKRAQLSNCENGKNAISVKFAAEIAEKLNQPLAVGGGEIAPKKKRAPKHINQLCLEFDKEYKFGPVSIKPTKANITVTTTYVVKR
jgi:transcriptional regulator with XRE-family HTH domain